MGQATLEQQQAEEMKERFNDYQLQKVAIQNDTDMRTQSAIQQGSEHLKLQKNRVAVVVAVL